MENRFFLLRFFHSIVSYIYIYRILPRCPAAIESVGLVINIRRPPARGRNQLDHGEIEDKKKKKKRMGGLTKKGHAKGRSGQEAIRD